MATSITNYTGNAGLGSGSNPQIPVTTNEDLGVINQTLRDISIQDAQRNMQMFQQKVRDRDTLNDLILQGQVPGSGVAPEYMQYLDEGRKRVMDAWKELGGNLNDTAKFANYANAVQGLKDVAAQARMKSEGIARLMQDAAKEANPRKRADIEAFIEKQKSRPFFDPVDPYQQLYNLSLDKILGYAKPRTSTSIDQETGVGYTETIVDFNDALRGAQNDFLTDDGAANQEELIISYQQLPEDQRVAAFDAINRRLAAYNQENNLTDPNTPGYVSELSFNDAAPAFAAKVALANQSSYRTRTPTLDKDIARLNLDRDKFDLDRLYKLGQLANQKKRADAYAAKLNADLKAAGGELEQNKLLTDLYNQNILNQDKLITYSDDKKTIYLNEIPYSKSLPIWTFDGDRIVRLQPKNSVPDIKNGRIVGFKQKPGAPPMGYRPIFSIGGERANLTDVKRIYDGVKKAAPDLLEELGINDIKGFIDYSINNSQGDRKWEIFLEGDNGTVNQAVNNGALRVISNKSQKKGQIGAFEIDNINDEEE